MSEAELHLLRQRLEQARRHKARRGAFFNHVPIGYVFLPSGGVALDPDVQVQAVVQLVFDKFDELGSARPYCGIWSATRSGWESVRLQAPTRGNWSGAGRTEAR